MTIVNIDKVAKAIAIALNSEEKAVFAEQVASIIHILDQLKAVDTSGVEPLMSVSHNELRLREDIAIDPHSEETVIKSSNHSHYGYFVTPKFVD